MANQADARRIAMSLPDTIASRERFAFSVRNKQKEKGFAWIWLERLDPKKARVPNPKVLAVRVRHLEEKDLLLGADGDKFFTEPHYNGFPAILVRLPAVGVGELRALLTAAWRCQAPRALVEAFEGGAPAPQRKPRPGKNPARVALPPRRSPSPGKPKTRRPR
jgi:hypothetical protein